MPYQVFPQTTALAALALTTMALACHAPTPVDSGGAKDTGAPAQADLAARIFAGPDEPGFDAELADKADRFDRQMLAVNAPFGLSLDAYLSDRTAVDDWMSHGSGYSRQDFEDFTGTDLYEQVYTYGEVGDLGMFGGVAVAAEAYRYALLKDGQGLGQDTLEDARQRVEQAMLIVHMMTAMTGQDGVLVRGLAPLDLPGMASVQTVALADRRGNPLPTVKGATWRDDFSGDYPDYLWLDDTSKDQWIGYVLALGALWEVVADDPDIDSQRKTWLQDDARTMGLALKRVNPETGLDLTLFDADGRTTTHPDLNAHEIEGLTSDSLINPFNALMALAGLKVFSVVSDDPDVDAFYQEVAEERGYADFCTNVGAAIYFYYATNYSNVNMAFTALHSLLHFEADPQLQATYQDALVSAWADGSDRAAWHFHSAWFDILLAAYLPQGGDPDTDALIETTLSNLGGFHDPPYWDDPVENCDEKELTTGHCLGIDGLTEIDIYGTWKGDTFVPGSARNAEPVATTFVPQSIRPADDFEWRSDPYRLNRSGSDGLFPGGDFRAAYWTGRYLRWGQGVSRLAR